MEIKIVKVSELIPYEKNPRKNDEAVEYVANSIKEFGFKIPIIVDKNNIIVAGHTRLKAAKKLGLKEVPIIVADDLSDEQIKAFRLADNKVSEIAEWDEDLLKIELADIVELDMNDFGFDLEEEKEEKEITEDNYEVVLPEEPKAKFGDIYQLGEHRLMCGDSTNIAMFMELMNGDCANLVLTDPPYNMNYEGAARTPKEKRKASKIANDNLSSEEFERFLLAVYKCLYETMNDGASFYIFYKELGEGVFPRLLEEAKLTFKQELIWAKNQLVLGGAKYQNRYEPFLFGCKGKSVKQWYGGRKQTSVIEQIDFMGEEELRDTIRQLLDERETDIVQERKVLVNDLHPTMKPIRLLARLISNSSKESDIVLDAFGGSGSTLIACEQTNRKCRMMEFEPKYIDVIIDRWEKFTGKKAVKIK